MYRPRFGERGCSMFGSNVMIARTDGTVVITINVLDFVQCRNCGRYTPIPERTASPLITTTITEELPVSRRGEQVAISNAPEPALFVGKKTVTASPLKCSRPTWIASAF